MRAMNVVVATVGTLALVSAASADVIAQIEVWASDENGSLGAPLIVTAPIAPDGSMAWNDGYTFSNGASVESVSFSWHHDPFVGSAFNVTSGFSNTTFTVNSSIVSFDPITSPIGVATAFIGVTNSSFGGNTSLLSLLGLQPGGNVFSARANAGANTFVDLIPGLGSNVAFAPGESRSYSGSNPSNPGYDLVPFTAADMQSQFKFVLSPFDQASGTSTYEIIPAPGAAALLGLGGLVALRRRRS